ncbi:hypothetical protein FA95DRAFT_1678906 [Auriscalpium vulgare]|uniref:Uncharacterized protein n=1 Tax=Auriscalpium vulgare TaxID=40419 RepID=A0ACB8RUZ6_9AGAM|nr:hypothetical protein FA95DRAFT_1678906 [Auriscalpium vulgare]
MPKVSKSQLAKPRGRFIFRTEAAKTFEIAPSDLDSILPISVQRNPRGRGDVKKYNLCDVQELYKRLKGGSAASRGGSSADEPFAERKGKAITRTEAMRIYKLKGTQLDRIRPAGKGVSVARGVPYVLYNECDVQALANNVETAKVSTAPPQGMYEPPEKLGHQYASCGGDGFLCHLGDALH